MTKRCDTYRIFAKDKLINNNTWVTGINNNDLIIGASGSGKTRGYVKPNIMCTNDSIIVVDTKGTLFREFKTILTKKGYQVLLLDFVDMLCSPVGYNPLSSIRYERETDSYNEQDIMMIAAVIAPVEAKKEPYWDYATRMELEAMIAYVMEALPKSEHHMGSVAKVASLLGKDVLQRMFREWEIVKPDSIAVKKWRMFENGRAAVTTQSCIQLMLAEKLNDFITMGAIKFAQHPRQIDFAELGRKKTAVFLNISDMDRSQDKFLNLVYTQAFYTLCRSADKDYENGRLKIPVRIILDDFAANTVIPDFDKIISVIRSREIYVSIILQSITQLNAMYGAERARTIINNCDSCLYLGGQDVETARYISIKVNKPIHTILDMSVNEAYLFVRGQKPCKVKKLSTTLAAEPDFISDNDFTESKGFDKIKYKNSTRREKNMNKSKTIIYTDGACSGNPGTGGYAIIMQRPDTVGNLHEQEYAQGFERTTNNRMELKAVIKALEMLEEPCEAEVYSDSKYVVDNANQNLETWIKMGWKKADKKPVKNVDLWKQFVELKNKHAVTLNYVEGHADNEYNNRCDKLAVAASNSDNLIVDDGYSE